MDDAQIRQLGRAIRLRRKAKGLTHEQLAEATGVSTEWISQLERGIGKPSLDGLLVLATALGTQAPALLTAALDTAPRQPVEDLLAEVGALDDAAVAVLVDLARALRKRWPA